MRYANARYENNRRELAYRIYITDSIQGLGEGKCIQTRFYDLLYSKPVEDKPAENIAHDILKRAGVEVIADG